MNGYDYHGTLMETLGISWLQWDIIDREESLTKLDLVIADLREKGANGRTRAYLRLQVMNRGFTGRSGVTPESTSLFHSIPH